MMTNHRLVRRALAPILVALFAASCGGSGHSSSPPPTTSTSGSVTVQVTDAPFPISSVTTAQVTVTEVSLQRSGSDGFVDVFNGTQTVDLLALRNGITSVLASAAVPAGSYD